jgi:hypothetical protein
MDDDEMINNMLNNMISQYTPNVNEKKKDKDTDIMKYLLAPEVIYPSFKELKEKVLKKIN